MSIDHSDESERNPFAQEMIAQRAARGWSQEDLAAQMFVSKSTISNIESCYRAPTPPQAGSLGSFGEAVIGGYRERRSRERVVPSVARFTIKRMQRSLIFIESVG